MKNYEVILAKPTTIDDWCIWDERDIKRRVEHTTAVICAFSEQRLHEKLDKLYPGVKVLKVREV